VKRGGAGGPGDQSYLVKGKFKNLKGRITL